jgi:hypothetical protein
MRGGTALTREVYLNPSHIISVSEDAAANESLLKEMTRLGLPQNTSFSKITLHEGGSSKTITVVGTPTEVYHKIKQKQILKG